MPGSPTVPVAPSGSPTTARARGPPEGTVMPGNGVADEPGVVELEADASLVELGEAVPGSAEPANVDEQAAVRAATTRTEANLRRGDRAMVEPYKHPPSRFGNRQESACANRGSSAWHDRSLTRMASAEATHPGAMCEPCCATSVAPYWWPR